MRVFTAVLLTLSLFWSGGAVAEPTIDHYTVNIAVDDAVESLTVETTLRLIPDLGGLKLVLNPKAELDAVTVDDAPIAYRFDRDAEEGPNIYIDGRLLAIDENALGDAKSISISYEVPIDAVSYWRAEELPDGYDLRSGLEIGLYTGWLPFPPSIGDFTYDVAVRAPEHMRVTGNGDVARAGETWHITSRNRQFDIPVFIGSALRTERFDFDGSQLEITHFGVDAARVEETRDGIATINALYTDRFGSTEATGGKFQFVFTPRIDGTSYSRRGFAVVYALDEFQSVYHVLGHEVGHFWWLSASPETWHDWLNESFSEYAALMAVRLKYGVDRFNTLLERYRKIAATTPAIWGINREDAMAHSTLYRKGPILLHDLRTRIGDETFFKFLQRLNQADVAVTKQFLEILAQTAGPEDAAWFEQQLKKGV